MQVNKFSELELVDTARYLFVELRKNGESPFAMFCKNFAVFAERFRPWPEGIPGTCGLRVELPSGAQFVAVDYKGDLEAWDEIVKEFCRIQGRRWGLIESTKFRVEQSEVVFDEIDCQLFIDER